MKRDLEGVGLARGSLERGNLVKRSDLEGGSLKEDKLATLESSAELTGPQTLVGVRPEIFDFDPDLGLKLGQTKPQIPGTVPTERFWADFGVFR